MESYTVIWIDDCDKCHETIVESNSRENAGAKIFVENENCVVVCQVKKL